MNAMPQFMRQSHHIARFSQIIQHHIGMHIGHGGMREGTGGFTGFNRRVYPPFGEKRFSQIRQTRIKACIGAHHRLAGLRPIYQTIGFQRKRCVSIPHLHFIQPQPFALELIITMADLRVGAYHSVSQRFNHFRFDMVG